MIGPVVNNQASPLDGMISLGEPAHHSQAAYRREMTAPLPWVNNSKRTLLRPHTHRQMTPIPVRNWDLHSRLPKPV